MHDVSVYEIVSEETLSLPVTTIAPPQAFESEGREPPDIIVSTLVMHAVTYVPDIVSLPTVILPEAVVSEDT